MNKNLGLKLVVIVGTLLVFVYGIFGVPGGVSGSALLASMQKRINLGLDLKAGMRTAKINYADVTKPDLSHPEQVVIKGVPPQSSSDLRTLVQDKLPEYDATSGANNTWTVTMRPSALNDLEKNAVTQAIETIRNRIDQLGVSEPIIEEHGLGNHQILVQLPGVDDPARVKEIMQSTAMLEIRQSLGGPYPSQEAALQDHSGVLPEDSVLMQGHSRPGSDEQAWYLVSRVPAVSGKDLRDAQPKRDENGQPSVGFTLTNEGGQRFYSFTSAHIGDSLAVVLDNKVQEVATIKGSIRDQGEISGGSMNDQQSKDLSMILRSGALPAGIKYLEERTVGPSLGSDSIRAGVRASVIGMAAVLIFMLVYYRAAGINADLALILNLVILPGFLGFSQATLTLPGIAGVILTVGMGVDSNVLIFERIREELRNGKAPAAAVDQGFARALLTIIDTHVTTIVSAAILILFGTGPVRGFAITLIFGLLANLFTAVFVSRVIFDAILGRKGRGEALSI